MRTEKWQMYIDTLQGHPSVCKSNHTIESMRFITELIPPKDFPRMLDVGCGEGLETKVLKDLGYNVIGITRGLVNVEYAQEHYPEVKVLEMDMHDLLFPISSFDALFLNHTFEHLYASFIAMLEMNSVLRMGGRVWIAMPEFKEVDDPMIGEVNRISHHHPNMLCWNLLQQLFEATGFTVLYKREIEGNPYFDNPYLLEKDNRNIHSDVKTALEKRKEVFG